MSFGELFVANARRPLEKGTPVAASRGKGEPVGLFITPKSLATIPGASFVVTTIGGVARTAFPAWGNSIWVTIGASLFVGAIIFVGTTSQGALRPKSLGEWFQSAGVALINSAYIVAATLGTLEVVRR